jgi:hypothetical protein
MPVDADFECMVARWLQSRLKARCVGCGDTAVAIKLPVLLPAHAPGGQPLPVVPIVCAYCGCVRLIALEHITPGAS